MSTKRRMYIGTENGLVIQTADGEEWRIEREALGGKRATTLVASQRHDAVYAAVPGDGVYLTTDGGRSWDQSFRGDVRCLATDPSNPATVYAGTEPIHLFRTTDGGDHWDELSGLQELPGKVREKWWFPIYPHEGHVLSIGIDQQDSKILYLGLEHGGIVRSDDGGAHWEDISAGIEYLDIHMVASDPRRQNLVYAATARAFYRSEDYGRDWILCENGLTRDYMHDFVLRPGPRSTLFMTTANGTPPAWMREAQAEAAIFRSDDEGLTWVHLDGGLGASMPRMIWAISGDPTDDASVYVGNGDYAPNLKPGAPAIGEVWVTPDLGESWSRICETASPIRSLCVTAA